MLLKKLLETKESPNALLPNFIPVKIREIFDKKEISEAFNNHFVNIGPNLAASIPESKTTFQNYIFYDGPFLSTSNLTDLELENSFAFESQIKQNVVKKVSDEILVILKHIFRISLSKGIFSDKLKMAWVTLIFLFLK